MTGKGKEFDPRLCFVPKDAVLTGFYRVKKDFARSEATKQSPKSNRDTKKKYCHKLYEKSRKIASLRSQNHGTYNA